VEGMSKPKLSRAGARTLTGTVWPFFGPARLSELAPCCKRAASRAPRSIEGAAITASEHRGVFARVSRLRGAG